MLQISVNMLPVNWDSRAIIIQLGLEVLEHGLQCFSELQSRRPLHAPVSCEVFRWHGCRDSFSCIDYI